MVFFLQDQERNCELCYHENEYCATVRLNSKCRGNSSKRGITKKRVLSLFFPGSRLKKEILS